MTECVFAAEPEYQRYRRAAGPDDHTVPPVVEELKVRARQRGLWNLFLTEWAATRAVSWPVGTWSNRSGRSAGACV